MVAIRSSKAGEVVTRLSAQAYGDSDNHRSTSCTGVATLETVGMLLLSNEEVSAHTQRCTSTAHHMVPLVSYMR
jgi:hypothetical protein